MRALGQHGWEESGLSARNGEPRKYRAAWLRPWDSSGVEEPEMSPGVGLQGTVDDDI